MNPTTTQTTIDPLTLFHFVPRSQWQALLYGLNGEERAYFVETIKEYNARIDAMPTTYATDGQGEQAIAYLHYCSGGGNWYITELWREGNNENDSMPRLPGSSQMQRVDTLPHLREQMDCYKPPTESTDRIEEREMEGRHHNNKGGCHPPKLRLHSYAESSTSKEEIRKTSRFSVRGEIRPGTQAGRDSASQRSQYHKRLTGQPRSDGPDRAYQVASEGRNYRQMEQASIKAFGLADPFGDGGELGYISIMELRRAGVELDLYWTPKTLAEIRATRAADR